MSSSVMIRSVVGDQRGQRVEQRRLPRRRRPADQQVAPRRDDGLQQPDDVGGLRTPTGEAAASRIVGW